MENVQPQLILLKVKNNLNRKEHYFSTLNVYGKRIQGCIGFPSNSRIQTMQKGYKFQMQNKRDKLHRLINFWTQFSKGHGKYSCRQKLNSIKAQVNYEINIYMYIFSNEDHGSLVKYSTWHLERTFQQILFRIFSTSVQDHNWKIALKNNVFINFLGFFLKKRQTSYSFLPITAYFKWNYMD